MSSPNQIIIKHSRVKLTRLEDENPQWIDIFRDYPNWRVFLIKDGNIYRSRHYEREVVFLEEIVNNGDDVRGRINNNYSKRKRKKVGVPFKVFTSPYTRRCQRLKRRRTRPRNLRQFNGTEKSFVERRLEDFTEWAKEKSRFGHLDYLKRQRKSLKEKGLDCSSSSSSSSPAMTPENDENRDPKNVKDLEEELKLHISMTEISRFQKLQNLQNQRRIVMSRTQITLKNLNVKENENEMIFSSLFSSKSSMDLEDQDQDQEIEELELDDLELELEDKGIDLTDCFSFFDITCCYIDEEFYTNSELLLFDPIEERDALELLFECLNDCGIFNATIDV